MYERVRDDQADRALLESLWSRFAPYCGDPHAAFLNDARTNLRGRVWEMALGCLLLDRNLELRKPPRAGPDFCVMHDGRPIWIEATIVDHGTGPDAVHFPEQAGAVPHDGMIRRYTSALESKRKQRQGFLKRSAIAPDDAFVTAINGSGLQLAHLERKSSYPDIVRAVYPIGEPHFVVPVSLEKLPAPTAELEVQIDHPFRGEIPRVQSPAGIPARAFLDPRYEGTSGVLFTASAPWAFTTSAMIMVHNAAAAVTISRTLLPADRDFWHVATANGFLIDSDDRR